MKNKALKISLVILVSLVLFVVLVLSLVKIGERAIFAPFFANSETEFKVPGIADGFIQQGFDYYEGDTTTDEDDRFLVSGYMKDDSSSRVYVLDKDGNALSFIKLRDKNGKRYTGHCGGIAHNGSYVYISNDNEKNEDGSIDVFSLNEILAGESYTTNMLGSIYVYLKPAFCYVNGGKLYTGNFHKDEHEQYKSPEDFIIGENNTAIMLSFDLITDETNFGVATEPSSAYSITSQVQGMCIADDKLVLSTSWGLSPSHLYIYDWEKSNKEFVYSAIFTNKEVYGDKAMSKPIPLYIINDEALQKNVTAPPMAEELVYIDGKVLVMNESASAKYIFGRFTSGNNVYGYIVND
ncbi:MAG: hypothetical protein IJ437_01795 [Clostridia bacterium]|nr:hypothetical protein [Clostridia bacterium]